MSSTSGLGSPLLRFLYLAVFALTPDVPVFADTANTSPPPAQQRIYVPPSVQVPDLRQRALSDAQKLATDVRLRVQVSGDAPPDPTKVVVVDQKPAPNTSVPMGSTITVVVQTPPPSAVRQRAPTDAMVAPRVTLTVVPDLLRHNLIEARPLMTTARLRLEVSGGEPEDTKSAIVMEQKPPPGTRVAVGSTVVVVVQVQRPTETTTVPDVRTKLLPDAQSIIAKAFLKIEVSGSMPTDPSRAVVVDEKPSPGTRVRVGSTVVVTVQTPQPELVVVPELRQQLLSNAQQRIRGQLRLEVSGGAPADPSRAIVVEQKPPEGTRVPPRSVVIVAVRPLPTPTDPPPRPLPPPTAPPYLPPPVAPPPVAQPPVDEFVQVPALVQRPLMDALQRVRGARLRLDVTGGWPSDPAHAVVHGQTPAEGTRVRIGSTVTVQLTPPVQVLQPPPAPPVTPPPPPPPTAVAPPPPPRPRVEQVAVPELRQHLLAEARPLVANVLLELRVQGQAPADETRVVVVNQRPLPGTRVAARAVVTVELAPALLAVPELRKHALDEARQMVDRAGFALTIMGDPPSNESRAQVIEQSPLPGTRAAAGSAITVRAKASQLMTWVVAGVGTLLAAGAAAGIARWRGIRSHSPASMPGVRIVASSDIGTQEVHSNGSATHAFALRLRSRMDAGAQTVDANATIVTEVRRSDG